MDSSFFSINTLKARVIQNALKNSSDTEQLFQLGLLCLRQKLYREACNIFSMAYARRPADPRFCSYYGLMLAMGEGRVDLALKLCEDAVLRDFLHPDFFCNLGKVYLRAGRRADALRTFNNGLKIDSSNAALQREIRCMGIRKPLLFPFLKRSNFLNRLAGKVRSALAGRKGKAGKEQANGFPGEKAAGGKKAYNFAGHPQPALRMKGISSA